MRDLESWPGDWQAHRRQAGCDDAIAVIETAADERAGRRRGARVADGGRIAGRLRSSVRIANSRGQNEKALRRETQGLEYSGRAASQTLHAKA